MICKFDLFSDTIKSELKVFFFLGGCPKCKLLSNAFFDKISKGGHAFFQKWLNDRIWHLCKVEIEIHPSLQFVLKIKSINIIMTYLHTCCCGTIIFLSPSKQNRKYWYGIKRRSVTLNTTGKAHASNLQSRSHSRLHMNFSSQYREHVGYYEQVMESIKRFGIFGETSILFATRMVDFS